MKPPDMFIILLMFLTHEGTKLALGGGPGTARKLRQTLKVEAEDLFPVVLDLEVQCVTWRKTSCRHNVERDSTDGR